MSTCSLVFAVFVLLAGLHLSATKTVRFTETMQCDTHNDCASDRVCTYSSCIDPCQFGACGDNTLCHVTNHVAHCSCNIGYTGHPFHKDGCLPPANNTPGTEQLMPDASSTTPKKKYHLFHDSKMNWYKSFSHCNSLGMRLATIHGQKGHERLVELIKEANVVLPGSWWIGATDLGQQGDYRWISSGAPLTYRKFAPGQPDNYHYPNKAKEHCVELRTPWDYAWNDYICEYAQYHICEEVF